MLKATATEVPTIKSAKKMHVQSIKRQYAGTQSAEFLLDGGYKTNKTVRIP